MTKHSPSTGNSQSGLDFVLHVGPMKTATTYIQYILDQNRSELTALGWTYPGQRPNQQHAFYGLCGRNIPWIDEDIAERYANLGKKLEQELSKRSQNAIVSCEALASLTEAGIEELLTKIPAPSKIVFTLRPLPITLKSGWQQFLKRGGGISLDNFISAAVEKSNDESLREISLTYLYGDAVRRWRKVAPCPIHLADIPASSNPDLTWQVFRAAAELPELPDRTVPRLSSNRSLSSDAAELLRRFNVTFIDTGLLRRQRQTEFVHNCLLAEPHLKLGSEQIKFSPETLKRLEDVDVEQLVNMLIFGLHQQI